MVSYTGFSKRLTSAFIFPLLYFGFGNSIFCSETITEPIITPDAKIQATIRLVIMAKDENDKEARKAMKKLTEMAIQTPEILAPQLIYHWLNVKNEKEGLASIGMMGYFTRNWGSEMRKALIPFLETKDQKVLREVIIWLYNIDGFNKRDAESKLTFYKETFLTQKKAPPPGLVNYVYDHAPSQALLIFEEIYLGQNGILSKWPHTLLWSDHVITTVRWRIRNFLLQEGDLEKAQKELDKLSKHDGWYARRYVVEIIRGSPKLGTPELVKRLKNDPSPLVSEAAKGLK